MFILKSTHKIQVIETFFSKMATISKDQSDNDDLHYKYQNLRINRENIYLYMFINLFIIIIYNWFSLFQDNEHPIKKFVIEAVVKNHFKVGSFIKFIQDWAWVCSLWDSDTFFIAVIINYALVIEDVFQYSNYSPWMLSLLQWPFHNFHSWPKNLICLLCY